MIWTRAALAIALGMDVSPGSSPFAIAVLFPLVYSIPAIWAGVRSSAHTFLDAFLAAALGSALGLGALWFEYFVMYEKLGLTLPFAQIHQLAGARVDEGTGLLEFFSIGASILFAPVAGCIAVGMRRTMRGMSRRWK